MAQRSKFVRVLAPVLAAGVALTMVGCSSGGSGNSGSIPVIQIWSRPGSLGEGVKQSAQKAFPDYKLKFVANEKIDDSLHAALRANSGLPDVAFLGGNLPDYFQVSNKFVDLNKYGFNSHVKDYFDFAIKSAESPDGRQIAMPTDVGPYVFFYNAAEFQTLGFPTDPDAVAKAVSNWADFKAMALKAKHRGKLLCDSPQGIYQLWMTQKGYLYFQNKGGESTLTVDSSINKAAFDNAASWANEGLCGTAAPYSTNWNAGVTQKTVVGFVEPAYVGGILKPAAKADSGKWRIATGTPGGPAAMSGSFVAAFASTKYPDVAAKLVLFFSSQKTQTEAYTTNGLIPSTVGSYKESLVSAPDPFYGGQVAINPIKNANDNGPFVFRGPNGNSIMNQFNQALVNVANGANPDSEYTKALNAAKNG